MRLTTSTAAAAAIVLSGCASQPYTNTFSGRPQADNIRVFDQGDSATRRAVISTLAQRGFEITKDEAKQINAKKSHQTSSGNDKTYKIKTQVRLLSLDKNKTQVTLVANQKTVLHQTDHTYFHLLWLIPLFPTGTQHSTHVLDAGTIQQEKFYKSFFKRVKKQFDG